MDIAFLDIFIRLTAYRSALTFREYGELKHNYVGHGTALREVDILTLIGGTNYLLSKLNFG